MPLGLPKILVTWQLLTRRRFGPDPGLNIALWGDYRRPAGGNANEMCLKCITKVVLPMGDYQRGMRRSQTRNRIGRQFGHDLIAGFRPACASGESAFWPPAPHPAARCASSGVRFSLTPESLPLPSLSIAWRR